MTERNVAGDAVRSKYRKAQKLAEEKGLSPAELESLAEGVREFDAKRTVEERTAVALEKLSAALTSQHSGGDGTSGHAEFEARRLRRREVYAQELMAVAVMADDVADEELVAIRETVPFKRLLARLKGTETGVDATP